MALIDKASLLMVPSTYEAGTLYNVLPSGNRAPDSTDQNSGYDQTRADFTFDRGSNAAATRVNADGLIEKYRENLLLQSNQFDTTWYNSNSTETGGQADKDGGTDAWLLTKTSTNGGIRQNNTTAGVQTFSFYAKAGDSNWVKVNNLGSSAYHQANFDLVNGVVGTTAYIIDAKIEDVGNGWFRCITTYNTTLVNIDVRVADSDNVVSGSSGSIYIQNAQLESGMVSTDYLDSGATTAKAGVLIDLPRINYDANGENGALLLEPQRANLVPYSEWLTGSFALNGVSIDLNNTISPEGTKNALKITDDTTTGYHKITDTNLFVPDGTMRTWSVFVKKSTARYCVISHASVFSSAVNSLIFDLEDGVYTNDGTTDYFDIVHDPINMGNGWWRIGFSSDLNSYSYDNFSIGVSQGATWSGNVSYTGDGSLSFYAFGAQLETGSYSTSYIPNHGESGGVTRAADSCSVTGVSDVIGQTEGVVFLDVDTIHNNSDTGATKWFFEVRKDANNSFGIGSGGADSAPAIRFVTTIGGVVTTESEPAGFSNSKIAIKYTASEFKIFQNGSLKATISKNIGGYNDVEFMEGAGDDLTMPLKQFILFDEALTDAECITLTTL